MRALIFLSVIALSNASIDACKAGCPAPGFQGEYRTGYLCQSSPTAKPVRAELPVSALRHGLRL